MIGTPSLCYFASVTNHLMCAYPQNLGLFRRLCCLRCCAPQEMFRPDRLAKNQGSFKPCVGRFWKLTNELLRMSPWKGKDRELSALSCGTGAERFIHIDHGGGGMTALMLTGDHTASTERARANQSTDWRLSMQSLIRIVATGAKPFCRDRIMRGAVGAS